MGFVWLSAAHLAALAAAVICWTLIVIWRRQLRHPRLGRITRWSLAVILLGSEISLQIWHAINGTWGVQAWPLQLCSMTLLLSAVLLFSPGRRLYELCFFLGILGALQALLTPNLDYTFPHFRYLHFFVAHIAIIAASVYMTAVERYRPTAGSVLRAIGWLHVLAVPAYVANLWTGSNFMFLARKPATGSMLDLLAPWPWYLLQLELVVWTLCFLLYGMLRLVDRLAGPRRRSNSGAA
ncbi:TIGR02206 family membrane protein [Paenibacillus daejeonensis]|uniref:YwaF family protein n=1 Tax=Paenibacillus daejeonensis TaxID=135193 RepID=UPI00038143FC|nr:TIGR02206 family membrane protein [Paenibacillus daejeonensis]